MLAASAPIITVGVVDDHQVLTEALAVVIRQETDLRYVGSAGTCAEAQVLVTNTLPQVLLLDVSLPDGDGLSLAPELKRLAPDTQILILTSYSDETTLLRAVDIGVNGFVSKNQPMAQVLTAIRQAAEGEIVMPASLLAGVLARTLRRNQGEKPDPKSLTPREKEILTQIAQGKSGQAIAEALTISPMTVRTHIRNLLTKLGAHSRLEAVTLAFRRGLIGPSR